MSSWINQVGPRSNGMYFHGNRRGKDCPTPKRKPPTETGTRVMHLQARNAGITSSTGSWETGRKWFSPEPPGGANPADTLKLSKFILFWFPWCWGWNLGRHTCKAYIIPLLSYTPSPNTSSLDFWSPELWRHKFLFVWSQWICGNLLLQP